MSGRSSSFGAPVGGPSTASGSTIQVDPDVLLTTQEAAAILKSSSRTLEGWRVSGMVEIPFLKIGRSVRYRRLDILAVAEKNLRRTTSDPGTAGGQ